MQPSSFLGMYISKDHATVVCLGIQGRERKVTGCFSVSLEAGEQSGPDVLCRRIAAACAERKLEFAEMGVALDSSMFMQHSVHSEFSDVRKITQTIRFDTEEALGTDVADVAIAFKIDSTDDTGSNLSVFTVQKQMLTELLVALQANNLDPVSVEPDVNCLTRFVCQNIALPLDTRPLFAFLSRRSGYFLAFVSSPWQGVLPTPSAMMRTFLLGAAQDRNELLPRQVSMTTALLQNAEPINCLAVFDVENSVDCDDIARKLTIQTERVDIFGSVKLPGETLVECPDPVEFAVAYGAAMAHLDELQHANWRSDFMPYQGRKMRLQKTLRFFSAAAVVLMLALGLYGFMQALQFKKYRARLREKFAKEYSSVMFGQDIPGKSREAVTRLTTAMRRIRDAQKESLTLTAEEAVAGKLALVLQAFNKCAASTRLSIDSVSITDKTITISGDTSSPESTLKVFDAFRQTGLNVLQQRISSDGGRSTFSVTVEPKG